MNWAVLQEVFAARANLTKKAARGAGMVFRGVSVQLRAAEFNDRG